MAEYLIIETRDPFASTEVHRTWELASALAKSGPVTVYLTENGVLAARESAESGRLTQLVHDGVTLLVDGFSLRERGIDEKRLPGGVASAPVDVVVDHLAAGHRVIWN